MAQTELVTMQLPSGEEVDVEVPQGWSDQQVTEYVDGLGLFGEPNVPKDKAPLPGRAEQFLYGAAKTPGLVEEAANLIEQKLTPKSPAVTRDVTVGGDVPMVDEQGNVQMDPRYPVQKLGEVTLPAVTEATIRAEQQQRKRDVLERDFPGMQGRADTNYVKAGSITRMLTDMITFPLPFANQVKLGKFAADGGKLMSAEGRALIGSAATEGGIGAGLFGAADASIRSMSETGELNAEQVGTAGLIAMAGGTALGPVLASAGGKFAGWLSSRFGKGDVNPMEVAAAGEQAGRTLTAEEATNIAEAMNRANDRAKVEAATVDMQRNPNSAMSVTKDGNKTRALTKEEKKVRAEIRKAFAEDADMADHYKRQAEEAILDREIAAQKAEVERQYGANPPNSAMADAMKAAYAKAGEDVPAVNKVMDEMALKRIQERQDSALAELERTRVRNEAPAQTAANDSRKARDTRAQNTTAGEGYDRPGLLGNADSVMNRHGERMVGNQFGQKFFEKVADYSPRAAMAMRKVETETLRMSKALYDAMPTWLGKDYEKMFKIPEWRRAVNNSDVATLERLKPGAGEVYTKEVLPVLEQMHRTRKVNGLPVMADVLHPRAVHDYKSVRRVLGREDRTKFSDAIEQWKRDHNGREPTQEDLGHMFGQVVGGRSLKMDRSRRIKEVTPEVEKYYVNPRNVLIDAVSRHSENLAIQRFKKDTLGMANAQLGGNIESQHISDLLGQALTDGNLDGDELTRLADLVGVFLGQSRMAPHKFAQALHNMVTLETLGFNPFSTMTQLADAFNNASKYGLKETMRGLTKEEADFLKSAFDAGVRSVQHDIRTPEGAARLVHNGLTMTGFDKLDKMFADGATRSAARKFMKQASENPEKLYNELTKWFEPERARGIVNDLRANRGSPDIFALVANDVADIRPLGRLDMPESYNRHPNLRVAYSLLSWTINQMNYVRNRGINQVIRGIKLKDGNMVKNGAKVIATITALNAVGGMTVGTLKDMLRGNEITPGREAAYALGAALPLALSGKYALDAMLNGRGGIFTSIPLAGVIEDHAKAIGKFLTTGEVSPLLKTSGWGRALLWLGSGFISDAEAAYAKPEGYTAVPKDATPLAPETVPAENNLPQGWEPLANPYGGGPRSRPVHKPDLSTNNVQQPVMHSADGLQLTVPKDTTPKQQLDVSRELIRKREGDEAHVYRNAIPDGKGGWKWDAPTAGIGHMLSKEENTKYPMGTPPGKPEKGARWIGPAVPQDMRDEWFKKDSTKAWNVARKQAKELGRPDMVPALASMVYQNGEGWNRIHKKTWKKLKDKQWVDAAAEAGDSLWAKQTPTRAKDFQRAIRAAIQ